MSEVLTTSLNTDTLRLFKDDIQANDFYIFVSSVTTGLNRLSAVDSQYNKNLFLEKTLFGKEINNDDVKYLIKYYPWQKGQTYIQYDDRVNLDGEKFYAVVGPTSNDTGDYRIYKCLYNNELAEVDTPPNYSAATPNQIYETADGYVWKFMYALTQSEFEAYNAVGYIPIMGDFDVDPTANASYVDTGSKVDQIFVENIVGNYGYPYENGVIAEDGVLSAGELIITGATLQEIADYYAGMAIYITNINGQSFLYDIGSYSYNASTQKATVFVVGDPKFDGVVDSASFQIFPKIEINGDGTGAAAIPTIVNNSITKINIIEAGSGYNSISARVVDPLYDFEPEDALSIDVRAELRPILSPTNGHATNFLNELHSRHILLYGYITETDNTQIGATNSYSYIGVVKNPEWANTDPSYTAPSVFDNRISIVSDQWPAAVVNDTLTQVNNSQETVFIGKVHEVDNTANTIYISEYMGAYQNQPGTSVSLDTSLPLFTSSGQTININTPTADNVITSDYVQRSGEVYFMEDIIPLNRSAASREEYKLVLQF